MQKKLYNSQKDLREVNKIRNIDMDFGLLSDPNDNQGIYLLVKIDSFY